MFSLFRPVRIKKLKKERAKKLEQAIHAQRNGDIKSYASITSEAEKLLQEIQKLEQVKAQNQSQHFIHPFSSSVS